MKFNIKHNKKDIIFEHTTIPRIGETVEIHYYDYSPNSETDRKFATVKVLNVIHDIYRIADIGCENIECESTIELIVEEIK